MARRVLKGLDSREYEHEFDRRALEALEGTPGLEMVVRAFNKHWNDKIFKVQITGSYIKVTEKNFPEVHRALKECCEVLRIDKEPALYIQWGCEINAYTAGVEDPIIVINSGCIDRLTYEELLFVIGHELGHIKSEHVLYHQMAKVLPVLGQIVGSATLGIGNLISTGLEVALLNWVRMSEFTGDRAGLLACQNIDAAANATIKAAGLPEKFNNEANIEEFKNQAREFESFDYDALDRAAKLFSTIFNTHPWSVMRAAEMYKWVENTQYKEVYDRASVYDENYVLVCNNCGAKMRVPRGKGNVDITCPRCKDKFSTTI